ncbi:MAG TPA: M1 family aminopeptidase [Candidatus Xenobia bacterium]|nr:M1 family aminopeptidase [Candidatus Xenobia bacterium]
MRKSVAVLLFSLLVAVWLAPPLAAQTTTFEEQAAKLRPPFGDPRAAHHWPRTRTYDVQHVKLEVSFDWEKKEVAGTATLTVAALNDGLRHVTLDAAEMKIESVLANERPLEFAPEGDWLHITLDRTYNAGEKFELAIRYRARPRKGGYFTAPDKSYPQKPKQFWTQGESDYNRYWFPGYDFPNEKATSETVVTAPADLITIGNGRLVEVREDKAAGTKTWHWREDVPHVNYLISLIVGRFDKHTEKAGDVPVEYYVPPGTDAATLKRSFEPTPAMIQFYADWIGIPYPYEKYAQTTVEDFLWGGMENISATTLYTDTLHDEAATPNWTSEGLVAHELVHQWWGNLLTCRDWSNLWLNEAFATFFTNLWYEHRYGRDEYDYRRWEDMQEAKKEDRDDYRRPIVMPWYVNEMDLFDSHTYPKGAVVLDMLRSVLGEAQFQKSLRHYAARHARQSVDTEDLRKAIGEATGQELGWFFAEWLYSAGYPEFSVTAEWQTDAKQLHLSVEQKQGRAEMTPVFRMPVEVEVTTSQGAQTFTVEVAHARDDFYFPLAEAPTRIRFDAGQRLLKSLEFPRSRAELIDLLQNDPNVLGRIWAAEQLARRQSDLAAVGALRDALAKEKFWGVRKEIARVLGEVKSPAAREALTDALRDTDARVRERAAESLGEFADDAEAAKALESVIEKEAKTYVVAAAVKSLGRVGAAGAFERLRDALKRDSHREVIRRAALEGLAHLGDARGLGIAMEWSKYGKPPRAREAAIEALGTLGQGNENTYNYLVSLLIDPYVWARQSALKALGTTGDTRAIPALEAFAAGEVERRLQREAEKALEKLRKLKAESTAAEPPVVSSR